MSPIQRYARLLSSLPDTTVPNPRQPVLVALTEQLGAPTGLSVDLNSFLEWAAQDQKLSPSTLWKLRETFAAWDQNRPTRHQVAKVLDWLSEAVDEGQTPA